jgi:hypothetical protein
MRAKYVKIEILGHVRFRRLDPRIGVGSDVDFVL